MFKLSKQLMPRNAERGARSAEPSAFRVPHFLVLAVVTAFVLVSCQPRPPRPPPISTAGLDPAVTRLIETTLAEVRAAPASGEAWGKLGSVLMHYEFAEAAADAFHHAEALAPAEPRWPYLHALLLLPREPGVALPKLRRAVGLCSGMGSVNGINTSTPSIENLSIPLTDPVSDAPRLRLAQFLAERGEHAEAVSLFEALLRSRGSWSRCPRAPAPPPS